jgi:hypothetical protein
MVSEEKISPREIGVASSPEEVAAPTKGIAIVFRQRQTATYNPPGVLHVTFAGVFLASCSAGFARSHACGTVGMLIRLGRARLSACSADMSTESAEVAVVI